MQIQVPLTIRRFLQIVGWVVITDINTTTTTVNIATGATMSMTPFNLYCVLTTLLAVAATISSVYNGMYMCICIVCVCVCVCIL